MTVEDGWYQFDNDLNSALAALQGTFIKSGGVCSEKGTPDMSVDMAEIVYFINGARVSKAATNVAIGAAPGSGARKDIMVGDSAGNISVVAGSAEAVAPSGNSGPETYKPKPPNIPTDKALIAEVWVVTGATEIYDADLTDRRVMGLAVLGQAARAHHSANQSIPNTTWTVLALNSERFDTDTIHDLVTNNSRLTCKTAGIYQITANVQFAGDTTGRRNVGILLNGAASIGRIRTGAGTGAHPITVTTLYQLIVGDYVEVEVYQDSGGALNLVEAANHSPEFSMVRVA